MKKHIAQISADVLLAHSREQLLLNAGYDVRTFHSSIELAQGCNGQRFDLLIVGHSLEYHPREQAQQLFRQQNPDSPVVQLTASHEPTPGADISTIPIGGISLKLLWKIKLRRFTRNP